MAVVTLKSAPITNLDATPVVPNTVGQGSAGRLNHVNGFVTTTAADDIASKYILARIPSNAVVKQVIFESEDQGATGAADVGLYYSTSTVDGTQKDLQGDVIDADLFASAVVLTAASRADVTAESGQYTLNERNMPIWQAAGLTSDPGGFFDVVATLTAALTEGAARLGAEVFYIGG